MPNDFRSPRGGDRLPRDDRRTGPDKSEIRQIAERRGIPILDLIMGLVGAPESFRENPCTLLAVCPNSEASWKATLIAGKKNNCPVLYAATLNQVDLDGGYTGYTPDEFVELVRAQAVEVGYGGPVIIGLDHGGPWLKDKHAQEGLTLEETITMVKRSLVACLEAGYDLLHIDATVDRSLPEGTSISIETVVERTLELMAHVEDYRQKHNWPPVSYEVGTEEVHGGLADLRNFVSFLLGIRDGLIKLGLLRVWPVFVVGKVGTDLHTTEFDPTMASTLSQIASAFGSYIKGHYTDFVANPADYPRAGMGAANLGPELTQVEYEALRELSKEEASLDGVQPSDIMDALRQAVVKSGRWKKWLLPDERGKPFERLGPDRQEWLVQTGCRYIWSDAGVRAARTHLYRNVKHKVGTDGEKFVIEKLVVAIERYHQAFNLINLNGRLRSLLLSSS